MRTGTTWPRLVQVLLLAWVSLGLASQVAHAQPSGVAVLQPDDVLKISVYGNPDLATTTRVLQNGTITFPLIGVVPVGGVTPAEAESRIADRLNRGGFVRNAAVSVFVDQRSAVMTRSATLLGQVGHSGQYSIDPSTPDGVTTLVALLAKAGGPTDKAADYCYLIRKENGQPKRTRVDLIDLLQNGNVKADMTLNNGDVVLVPQMDVFYIYGEVQKPGQYKLERDMTIMQGVSVASGLTARGNVKGIVLNRKENGVIASRSSELTDRLQPNDVVYVKTAVF